MPLWRSFLQYELEPTFMDQLFTDPVVMYRCYLLFKEMNIIPGHGKGGMPMPPTKPSRQN